MSGSRRLAVLAVLAALAALPACRTRGTPSPTDGPANASERANEPARPEWEQVLIAEVPSDQAPEMRTASRQAMAIAGDTIVEVMDPQEAAAGCQDPCQLRELPGFVIPGFHDAHSHPYKGGALAHGVRVHGSNVDTIVAAVEAFAAKHPDATWIVGRGWDAASVRPHRRQLDRAEVGGRPIALTDSDGHAVWVNSAALAALKVDAKTIDPPGGTIVRDKKGPTGLFLEGAREVVYAGIEVPDAELEQHILTGQEALLHAGFTAWQGGPVDARLARAYARLDARGEIVLRTHLWADLEADDETFEDWLQFGASLPENGRVHLSAFKGFVDGVFSTHSAALLQPYADDSKARGKLRIEPARLRELVARANRAGYRVALHAIGDRAVREALDAFAHSKEQLQHDLFNSVEHIESLDPSDARRFAALGVVASMQPTHFAFSEAAESYYPSRLGPARLEHTFPWHELVEAEALVAFGTDYPVVPADPIAGIHAAVHRRHGDGKPFAPEQAIAPAQALTAFTAAPAAVVQTKYLGRLAPGHLADLVVLRHDPLQAQADSADEEIMLVMVAGKVVWEPQDNR